MRPDRVIIRNSARVAYRVLSYVSFLVAFILAFAASILLLYILVVLVNLELPENWTISLIIIYNLIIFLFGLYLLRFLFKPSLVVEITSSLFFATLFTILIWDFVFREEISSNEINQIEIVQGHILYMALAYVMFVAGFTSWLYRNILRSVIKFSFKQKVVTRPERPKVYPPIFVSSDRRRFIVWRNRSQFQLFRKTKRGQ